jgi:PhnO protein
MELDITIRKIDKTDFEFIYRSLCDLENETFDPKVIKEILDEHSSNPNHLYLIAENNIERMGFISLHTQKLMHHCGLVGEIQEFYVHAKHRGKKVGRLLMDEIMNFADLHQLKSIEVTTNKKRIENVAIYQNLGFVLTHNKFTISK